MKLWLLETAFSAGFERRRGGSCFDTVTIWPSVAATKKLDATATETISSDRQELTTSAMTYRFKDKERCHHHYNYYYHRHSSSSSSSSIGSSSLSSSSSPSAER